MRDIEKRTFKTISSCAKIISLTLLIKSYKKAKRHREVSTQFLLAIIDKKVVLLNVFPNTWVFNVFIITK